MSKIFPVKDVTLAKQGDGSHIVTVIHSQGVNTDVTFPYCANGQDMAVDYLKHINEIRIEQAAEEAKKAQTKANTFGIAVQTPAKPAPTVVNAPPVVNTAAAVVPPPAPTAPVVPQQTAPAPAPVIDTPVPAGTVGEAEAPAGVYTTVVEEAPAETPAPAQE